MTENQSGCCMGPVSMLGRRPLCGLCGKAPQTTRGSSIFQTKLRSYARALEREKIIRLGMAAGGFAGLSFGHD